VKTYDELLEGLKEIKKQGWVKTHRSGNTGIGKTLEDLLGIEENNFASPDGLNTELKAGRRNASSMLTLFTKSPNPPKINSILLKEIGYPEKKGSSKKILHTTINAKTYNRLKGGTGLKVSVKSDRVILDSPKLKANPKIPTPYWDKETLKKQFEKKYVELLYVKADSRGSGSNEEFHFNEAYLMKGFDFENFLKLLREGTILVDIRIGQYLDGRPHDHGTGFRVMPDKLDLCFAHRKKVL